MHTWSFNHSADLAVGFALGEVLIFSVTLSKKDETERGALHLQTSHLNEAVHVIIKILADRLDEDMGVKPVF